MDSIIYYRIKELCEKKGIPVSKLELDLNFSNGSVKKWDRACSPSADKVLKIANYFGVSVDYLLGATNIISPASEIIGDEDIISFQRAREKMTTKDRERMMQMLRLGFEYAFQGENKKQ